MRCPTTAADAAATNILRSINLPRRIVEFQPAIMQLAFSIRHILATLNSVPLPQKSGMNMLGDWQPGNNFQASQFSSGGRRCEISSSDDSQHENHERFGFSRIAVLTTEENRVNILPARLRDNALGQGFKPRGASGPDPTCSPFCVIDTLMCQHTVSRFLCYVLLAMRAGASLLLWPGSEMNFARIGASACASLSCHASIQAAGPVGPNHFKWRRNTAISSDAPVTALGRSCNGTSARVN